jgi:hypothetical protein
VFNYNDSLEFGAAAGHLLVRELRDFLAAPSKNRSPLPSGSESVLFFGSPRRASFVTKCSSDSYFSR